MSWIVWLNSLWTMTLLTLIVLLVINMFFKRLTTRCYLFGSFIFPLLWTPSMMEKMLAGIT